MALTQFTNLNFEDIKTSIKNYLRENSKFSDFDFEGSNFSVLLNTLAYNSYITAYNTNMVANESFIDSATLRENVVSLARNIGYVPRSKRAAVGIVRFNLVGITSTSASVSIQPGIFANGGFNQTNYLFSLAEKLTVPANNGRATGAALIHQGQYLEKKWTVDLSQPNQTYILPNNNIDLSTLNVKIQNSASDTTVTNFKSVDSIVGVDGNSNIYLTQETTDEKYELIFGDGIFGKKLETGNVITASYIVTDGPTGNGVKQFNFAGTIKDDSGADINNFEVDLRTLRAAEGGDDIESVESIRNYAPRRYAAQNRAVTATDYESLLPSIYPNIESVSAYGGEDLNPPQYGRVFIAAKPRNGNFLPNSTKTSILKSLKSYSIAGIVPSFVDLKFLYVELDSYVYYNTNFIGAPDNLKADVIDAVSQFGRQGDLNKFGGRFKYSKLVSVLDSVDDAITSNITNVLIRRNLKASVNVFTQYELCFDNEFYHELDEFNIKSTGFSVSGVTGTVYLADKVTKGSNIGRIFLFKITDATEIEVVIENFGTVDYEKGEILINTVNITSTLLPENIVEIQAVPLSNDVLGRKELYLQLSTEKSNFTMRQDLISSGANLSGTRFDVQSSYSNGNKVRGAIVSSSSSVNSVQIDNLSTITPVTTSSSTSSSSSSSSGY